MVKSLFHSISHGNIHHFPGKILDPLFSLSNPPMFMENFLFVMHDQKPSISRKDPIFHAQITIFDGKDGSNPPCSLVKSVKSTIFPGKNLGKTRQNGHFPHQKTPALQGQRRGGAALLPGPGPGRRGAGGGGDLGAPHSAWVKNWGNFWLENTPWGIQHWEYPLVN